MADHYEFLSREGKGTISHGTHQHEVSTTTKTVTHKRKHSNKPSVVALTHDEIRTSQEMDFHGHSRKSHE